MIISKFGFRKQFGKPEALGNSSNIYEALIDQDGSDNEGRHQRVANFIPNVHDYSAIMANQSTMHPEHVNQYREVSSRLGIATQLFMLKPTNLNTSKSYMDEMIAGNASRGNISGIGGFQSMSRGNIPSGVGSGNQMTNNQSYMDYTRCLLDEIGNNNNPDQDLLGLAEDGFKNINDEFVPMEYPTGIWHLLKILWTKDEKRAFSLSNPDGYFYLLYVKTIIKFLTLNFVLSGVVIMTVCYYSNL